MTSYGWVSFGIAALLAAAGISSFAAPAQRIFLLVLAYNAKIGVPDELDARLRARAALRLRGACVVGFFAVVITAITFSLADIPLTLASIYITVAVTAVGLALGTAGASLFAERRTSESSVRVARLRAVRVSDYIQPWRQAIAWPIIGIGIVGGITCVCLSASDAIGPHARTAILPIEFCVAIAAVGVLLYLYAVRTIVRRGAPAGSTDELIWDDALRSSALKDALFAPVAATFMAGVLLYATIGTSAPLGWPGQVVGDAVVVLGLAYAVQPWRSGGYYLKTLWPQARRRTPDEQAAYAGTEAGPYRR